MPPADFVAWMANCGHSDISLAYALGISTSTVYRWRTGRTPITPRILRTLRSLERQDIP